MKLLLIFYDLLLILSIPFYLISLVFKGKFRLEVFERFKSINKDVLSSLRYKDIIWLHAVSLGEVSTCKSLIKQLSLRYPDKIVLITTITSTGRALAQSLAKGNVLSFYMPFDLSFLVKSFINAINLKILILIETELWPNLLYYIQKKDITTLVLNARLSDRSFGKYQLFSWLVKKLSKGIKMFCVQSRIDGDRFQSIGIDYEKIRVTGNMKFDAIEELDTAQLNELGTLKEKFALDLYDFFIVAGSTHEKEEEYLLDAFLQLKKDSGNLRLLIAPRHLERLDSIQALIDSKGIKSEKISEISRADKDSVLLVDSIGKLRLIYSLADLVFVGGSLVPVGGHNILEPAFFTKPIVVGPYMHNFREINQLFLSNQAMVQVKDKIDFSIKMKELISQKDKLSNLGRAAKSVVASRQGATANNLSIIVENIL